MAESFLRSDRGNHFRFRIQLHAIFIAIFFGDFPPQSRHAVGNAVAMIARILGRLRQFLDHRIRRWIGRIAHPQVDNIDTGDALLVLHLVDAPKQIRRQTPDALRDFDFEIRVAHRSATILSARAAKHDKPHAQFEFSILRLNDHDSPVRCRAW